MIELGTLKFLYYQWKTRRFVKVGELECSKAVSQILKLLELSFRKKCTVLGNGIVCIHDREYKYLVLWNPLSGKSRLLPEQRNIFSTIAVGFGYDEYNADMKVITIRQINSPGKKKICEAEVYSCLLDSWSRLNNIPGDVGFPGKGICSGSKFFWFLRERRSSK